MKTNETRDAVWKAVVLRGWQLIMSNRQGLSIFFIFT